MQGIPKQTFVPAKKTEIPQAEPDRAARGRLAWQRKDGTPTDRFSRNTRDHFAPLGIKDTCPEHLSNTSQGHTTVRMLANRFAQGTTHPCRFVDRTVQPGHRTNLFSVFSKARTSEKKMYTDRRKNTVRPICNLRDNTCVSFIAPDLFVVPCLSLYTLLMHGMFEKNFGGTITCPIQNPDTPQAGRVGRHMAGRLGGVGPAGWDADGFVCARHNYPSCSPGHRKQLSRTILRKHEQHYLLM